MNFHTVRVERHGNIVEEHPEMDALRKTQCLCLNCRCIGWCKTAKKGLAVTKEDGVAFAVTRCAGFLETLKEDKTCLTCHWFDKDGMYGDACYINHESRLLTYPDHPEKTGCSAWKKKTT